MNQIIILIIFILTNPFLGSFLAINLTLSDFQPASLKNYTSEENSLVLREILDTYTQLQFTCKANIPIRWFFTHEMKDSVQKIKFNITKQRRMDEFISILQLDFIDKDTKREFPPFGCGPVDATPLPYDPFNPRPQPSNDGIKWIRDSNAWINNKNFRRISIGLASNQIDLVPGKFYGFNDQTCLWTFRVTPDLSKYACLYNHNKIFEGKFLTCRNPDECGIFTIKNNSQCINDTFINVCSKDCFRTEKKNPSVLICISDGVSKGVSSAKIIIPLHDPKIPQTKLVSEVDDVIRNESLHLDAPVSIYLEERILFNCSGPMFLFTLGFQWTIEEIPGNSSQVEALDILNSTSELFDEEMGLIKTSREFTPKKEGKLRIICQAPIWNSKDFTQTSLHRAISNNSEKPRLIKIRPKSGKWRFGDRELECTFSGIPSPDIIWRRNKDSQPLENGTSYSISVWKSLNYTKSILHLNSTKEEASTSSEINFTCVGRNFKGNSSHTFPLNVKWQWRKILALILGVLALLIIVILSSLLVIILRRRRIYRELPPGEVDLFLKGNPESSGAFLLPYDKGLEVTRGQFQIYENKVLGYGAFGKVYHGKKERSEVAIKTLNKGAGAIHTRAILSELKILCFLGRSDHIVRLLGASTGNIRKGEIYMLFELCPHGNLANFLKESRRNFTSYLDQKTLTYTKPRASKFMDYSDLLSGILTSQDLVRWSYEISSGMEYISGKNIIHGDIAARNILLTSDLRAKISDFGLSKQLYDYSLYVQRPQIPLPLKWLAPESLRDLEFSVQSDIWAFGITLWEIYTLGESPYPGLQFGFHSWKMLNDGHRLDFPPYSDHSIWAQIQLCWEIEPSDRPKFSDLRAFFRHELISTFNFLI